MYLLLLSKLLNSLIDKRKRIICNIVLNSIDVNNVLSTLYQLFITCTEDGIRMPKQVYIKKILYIQFGISIMLLSKYVLKVTFRHSAISRMHVLLYVSNSFDLLACYFSATFLSWLQWDPLFHEIDLSAHHSRLAFYKKVFLLIHVLDLVWRINAWKVVLHAR